MSVGCDFTITCIVIPNGSLLMQATASQQSTTSLSDYLLITWCSKIERDVPR